MQRITAVLFGILSFGVIGLIVLAVKAPNTQALTMGFGALFGLCSIAFTQHLNARAELMKSLKERLQDARGLARALASEIGIFGNVLLAKSYKLTLDIGNNDEASDGIDPEDLLRFIQLPSRVIFDSNAGKIPLLEVIEKCGEFKENEEKFVERVVGFYQGVMDLRSEVSGAQLQNRKMTLEEVSRVQENLQSNATFALILSKRLREFIHLSESHDLASSGTVAQQGAACDCQAAGHSGDV